MGHFSMTCSASGLPISGGTPVRCLLLVASPYDDARGASRGAWVARTPPLRAVYNDYGTIEKVHEEDKAIADLWLRGLQEDLVVKGLGDNSYHDLPTDKSMTFDQLLDALRAGRVEVHQDARNFWRRPLDDSWMDGLKEESLPMFKRVGKVVATIGKVDSDAAPDTYVVDEPVPNLVRVRFGKYQHDDAHKDALARAKEAVEKAGFASTIAAGSGRYPDDADLIVLNAPAKQNFKGAQWDMATGQKSADDKRLSVRLAMVREDVWQELIAYPRSQYVALDCTNCGQSPAYHGGQGKSARECPNESINNQPFKAHGEGSTYAHGPVFPEGVEHVVTKSAYGSEYAWFGLAAFKHNIRDAWNEILAYFDRQARIERGEKVEPTKEEEAEEKKISPEIEKLLAGFEAKRKEEEKRVAALPQEEQDKIKADQKAASERRAKVRQDRLDNPVFGDFHISDFVLPHRYDDVGTWIFRHDLPGVLGIPDHLSMCLADKKEVTVHLLDAIAELAAFQYAMHDVGCVWKPAASTGPQDPEWREQVRFHATLLAISRKQSEKYIEDMDSEEAADLPTNISAAIARFKTQEGAK